MLKPIIIPVEHESELRSQVFYSIEQTPFGKLLVVATERGICRADFVEDESEASSVLAKRFASRTVSPGHNVWIENSRAWLATGNSAVSLHLQATAFQLTVWKALLALSPGETTSYGKLSQQLAGDGRSARAIGGAVGSNPVALFIPCHRVVRAGGEPGGYAWGNQRKREMLGAESRSQTVISFR